MKKKVGYILGIVFSGIGCTALTLLAQYFGLVSSPRQVIIMNYNGQQIILTADSYQNTLDHLTRLEREIERLSAVESPVTPSSDNVAEVWLRNGENIDGCPQVIPPEEPQIVGSTYYEMRWEPFEEASTYKISIWKDANYGTPSSDIIAVGEIEINDLSYTIDFSALEQGYVYGFNVVVDDHYSAPLLVELQ